MNIPEVTTSSNAGEATTEPELVSLPMVCRCNQLGDPMPDTTEALRAWALEHLGERVFSHAVMELTWNYDAEVTWIGCDMWFGITVETYDHTLRVRVECDELEDGIAAIVRYFHERFGAGRDEVDFRP